VLRPLADAGLDKAAVRRVARVLDLPCADKPAAPCLASRIPHFHEVTPHKLAQVEAAEAALRRAALRAALALEADLISAYAKALKMLVEPNTAMTVGRLAASHAQQQVLLRRAAGRDPLASA
jgi:PP-loop superfamily ATP-utilizing enzyme